MCSPREFALIRERTRIGMPSPSTAAGIGAGLVAFVALLYLPPVYAALGVGVVTLIMNIAQVSAGLILVALTVRAWWTSEPGELLKTLTGCLAIGVLLWMSGQVVNTFVQASLGPYYVGPTLADALWLAGYVPLIFGLYLRLHTFALGMSRVRWTAIIAVNILMATLAIFFVVKPILEHPDPSQPLMTVINVLYIVGDLVIVLTASLIVQTLSRGSMAVPWALIAAGCLMFSTSDMLFAYGAWSGTFVAGGGGLTVTMFFYNILFLSAYVTAAVGTYWLARLHRVI